jgi:uncharacterized membrane-anchored protein
MFDAMRWSKMRWWVIGCVLILSVPNAWTAKTNDAESAGPKINWQKGPTTGRLGQVAEVKVPAGFMFADAADTKVLMEAMQNPLSGTELGFLSPTNMDWFIVFEFSAVGYVKDDEKDKLDANAVLESLRKGTEAGNKERKKRGWAELTITGWEIPPRYDNETHNLEWATRLESLGKPGVNYNTRILGRRGVMSATMVADPEVLAATVPVFKSLLKDYTYVGGERYAEDRQGDQIAKYGLTALMVGGAAAVAAKSGLLKGLWKIIVVAAVAIGAFIKKLMGKGDDSRRP